MRKVLIISPRFPPVNAPDHQRVRMALPHFEKFGWKPTVLCVTAETSDSTMDPILEKTVPSDVRVVRVAAWSEEKCRRFFFGHLDYRSLVPLYRAGSRLLKVEHFDLIFFSTTVFPTFALARLWKRKFGVPVVFDFQDPWFAGSQGIYNSSNAPGGNRKYRMSLALARLLEPIALKAADFVIAVSDGYVRSLKRAYSWLKDEQFKVLPFGTPDDDFALLQSLKVTQNIFPTGNGSRNLVYVGRAGMDMDQILEVLFDSLRQLRNENPERWSKLKFHFVGTNYSPEDRTSNFVQPIADRFNVSDLSNEHSKRIPYFEALSVLRDSDGVLLLGSTTADYTPSKLFPCLMSGRPVFALAHSSSLLTKLAPQFEDVKLATFDTTPQEEKFLSDVRAGLEWFENEAEAGGFRHRNLAAFSAIESTRAICDVFDCVAGARASNAEGGAHLGAGQ